MKVTKYPHSCFKLEKNGSTIIIDAGNFSVKDSLSEIGTCDALLVTHEHPDHGYEKVMLEAQSQGIPIYANESVAAAYPSISVSVVNSELFSVGSIKIQPMPMLHSKLVDGSDGPENTGYIFDNNLLHAGDCNAPQNIEVEVAMIAIAGPDISMKVGADLAKSIKAKKVIPMHYDNPVFYNDPHSFKERLAEFFETIVLEPGESLEV